jgi:hypothetical protein
MGSSVKSIAAYLEENKIRGDPDTCPLSVAYKKAMRQVFRNKKLAVSVDGVSIEVDLAGENVLSLPMTKAESRFIEKFDDSNVPFPQLLKTHR